MARRTVVVGDSLGVGTVPYLQRALGGKVAADVRVGRSSADGVNALSRLLRGGADRVVLDLGTNDGSAQQLRQSVRRAQSLAGDRPIYIPTVNGPGAAQKNAMLRSLAGGNIHLVNWANQSHGLTGPDGIHASGAGYQKRAQIVAHSIASAPMGSVQSGGMGLQGFGPNKIRQEDIPAILAMSQQTTTHEPSPHAPQPTGSLADLTAGGGRLGSSAVRLGQGMHAGGLGRGFQNFGRYAVNRGGKMLEAHDYGDGDVRYFARKNPAILQAAVQQKLGGGQPGAPAMPAGLAPQDLELIKRLLGGGTLTR